MTINVETELTKASGKDYDKMAQIYGQVHDTVNNVHVPAQSFANVPNSHTAESAWGKSKDEITQNLAGLRTQMETGRDALEKTGASFASTDASSAAPMNQAGVTALDAGRLSPLI